jgi:hypothetical protein
MARGVQLVDRQRAGAKAFPVARESIAVAEEEEEEARVAAEARVA